MMFGPSIKHSERRQSQTLVIGQKNLFCFSLSDWFILVLMKNTIDANDFQQLLLKISNEGKSAGVEADSQEEDTDTANYRDEGFSDVEVSSDESMNLDHGEEDEMVSEPESWIDQTFSLSMSVTVVFIGVFW